MNLLTDKMLAKGKDKFMSWLYLVLAIIFETSGTTLLKFSNGFTVVFPSIGAIISYALCFLFLSCALRTINMSVAYAIWGALGILLISAIGMIFLHESVSVIKVASILLIVLGTAGLRLAA